MKNIFFPAAKRKLANISGNFSQDLEILQICPDIQCLTFVKTSDLTFIICLPTNATYSDCYVKVMLHHTLHSTCNPLSSDYIHYVGALYATER